MKILNPFHNCFIQDKNHITWFMWSHLVPNFFTIGQSGLQLRKSFQNGFHDNFLNSEQNPMMWPSLKSSLRDDSNEWSHHMVWLGNKKVSILKTINFRPYLLPCIWFLPCCSVYHIKLTKVDLLQNVLLELYAIIWLRMIKQHPFFKISFANIQCTYMYWNLSQNNSWKDTFQNARFFPIQILWCDYWFVWVTL